MFRLFCTALLLVAPVLAQAEDMHGGAHAAATPVGKAYAAAMDKMMGAMHMKPTGDADKDFVAMMLPHHQGAVDMAEVELKYGKDPTLLALARAVVEAQNREMSEMREWQAKHGK